MVLSKQTNGPERSVQENNLRHQGMANYIDQAKDPLLNLTFGACTQGAGLVNRDARTLVSESASKHLTLSIHPQTAQTETAAVWLRQLEQMVRTNDARDLHVQHQSHQDWWAQFWNRS